jgi:hypothetical protein
MSRVLAASVLLVLLASCGDAPEVVDHQAEWRAVLEQKRAAIAPNATPQQKQAYADALAAFSKKHPQHGRARTVYTRVQLEFAEDLASIGRHRQAIRFFRSVLDREPDNLRARTGLATSADRIAVSRAKLLELEKGMNHRQVASKLGKPLPGWSSITRRREATMEAWYYRTTGGGVAAVYFRNGKVVAAEERSDARTTRLGT